MTISGGEDSGEQISGANDQRQTPHFWLAIKVTRALLTKIYRRVADLSNQAISFVLLGKTEEREAPIDRRQLRQVTDIYSATEDERCNLSGYDAEGKVLDVYRVRRVARWWWVVSQPRVCVCVWF